MAIRVNLHPRAAEKAQKIQDYLCLNALSDAVNVLIGVYGDEFYRKVSQTPQSSPIQDMHVLPPPEVRGDDYSEHADRLDPTVRHLAGILQTDF